MARRSRCWTAHLVLVLALVVTARCSVGQQPQLSRAFLQLQTIITSAAADAAHIVSRLEARLDALNDRLDSLDGLNSRLDSLNASLAASLDELNTRLDSQNSSLAALNTRQDGLNASLAASLDELNIRLDSQNSSLAALNTRLDSLNASLAASLDELNTRLDSQNSSLAALNTRLDGLNASLVASLDELNTRVNISVAAAQQIPPRDCSDLPTGAGTGVYTIQPGGNGGDTTNAYCDMDTEGGGWTVFQRRADLLPRQNFFLDWAAYRTGFGNMTGEFWWGLEKLHLMTSALDRRYELRVDLGAWDGATRHALYQDFRISPETDGYRLSGGTYSGDAGNSLDFGYRSHFGQQFSTKDRDQDSTIFTNCAQKCKSAWWFSACGASHLNGEYLTVGTSTGNFRGILWYGWKGWGYSLKTAEMKVRPRRHV